MSRSSMSASLVALVIFAVRADPLDHDDPGAVRHGHFQPVHVALYVEDHHAFRQEACAGVTPANVLRRGPRRAFDIGQPVLTPGSGLAVLAAERSGPFA